MSAELDRLLGINVPQSEAEFKTVLNVRVPVVPELTAIQAAEYEHLSLLANLNQIGALEFYLRMFCVYTMHPQASSRVPWEYLQTRVLNADQRSEVSEKMKSILLELQEQKDAVNSVRADLDPREDDPKEEAKEEEETQETN